MFRFTIRELLILTVTVGLAVGWWMDRRQLMAQNRYLTFEQTQLQVELNRVTANCNELLDTVRKCHSALQR